MVSMLDSRLGKQGSSPGWGFCGFDVILMLQGEPCSGQAPHPGAVEVLPVAQCYHGNWYKLLHEGPLGLNADLFYSHTRNI